MGDLREEKLLPEFHDGREGFYVKLITKHKIIFNVFSMNYSVFKFNTYKINYCGLFSKTPL